MSDLVVSQRQVFSRSTTDPIISTGNKLLYLLSHVIRKPKLCKCYDEDTDQVCGNCAADQHDLFFFINSTIPVFFFIKPKSQVPIHILCQYRLVCVRPGRKSVDKFSRCTALLSSYFVHKVEKSSLVYNCNTSKS